MIYKVVFRKLKTYWWDEDEIGDCLFSAADDEVARSIVTTILLRMNRQYWRMEEPRWMVLDNLSRLNESSGTLKYLQIDTTCLIPLTGFRKIREVLNAFFPLPEGGSDYFRWSLIPLFLDWRPLARKNRTRIFVE